MMQGCDCSDIQWRMALQSPRSMPATPLSYTGTLMHQQADTHTNRVIVVDHDSATTELIAEILASIGCVPLCYATGLLSVASIDQARAHLLILELVPGDSGAALDLLGELRKNPQTRALPVIVNSTDN